MYQIQKIQQKKQQKTEKELRSRTHFQKVIFIEFKSIVLSDERINPLNYH